MIHPLIPALGAAALGLLFAYEAGKAWMAAGLLMGRVEVPSDMRVVHGAMLFGILHTLLTLTFAGASGFSFAHL